MAAVVFQKMMNEMYSRIMKGKEVPESLVNPYTSTSDYSAFAGYFGKTTNILYTWIVDSGSSTHMCYQRDLFKNLNETQHMHVIRLPDGSIKRIKCHGEINLTTDIMLKNALYVPGFKFNLLLVSQLAENNGIEVFFLYFSLLLIRPEN